MGRWWLACLMFLASGWLRHEFARIFGEVLEVDLVASHSGITQLVVRFATAVVHMQPTKSWAEGACTRVTGWWLQRSFDFWSKSGIMMGWSPIAPHLVAFSWGVPGVPGVPIHQVTRISLWSAWSTDPMPTSWARRSGASRRHGAAKPKIWRSRVARARGGPGGDGPGPVFELLPLRPGERAKLGEVLRIVPWGPSIITVGKNRKCDLYVTDEMAGVSNSHAELQLMQSRAAGIRLFISDSSKNGTWVNEHRLPKGAMRELKDGDQLRLADVPRFALRKFESLQQCQRAPIPVDGPEFKVPPCPYFIKKVKSTPKQSKQSKQASHLSSLKDLKGASTNAWAEVPRVPDDDGTELWAEVPRLPEEDLPSSANDEPEPPVTRKRARRWKKGVKRHGRGVGWTSD